MPMFYFRPFNFHKKKPSSPYDITEHDVLIAVIIGIVALALLIGLIGIPAYMVWQGALQ
jgi:hypothetical protein